MPDVPMIGTTCTGIDFRFRPRGSCASVGVDRFGVGVGVGVRILLSFSIYFYSCGTTHILPSFLGIRH